jgi:ribosomal protein S20
MSATALSQLRQIMLTDLKDWINKETASIVEPLRNKGTNLLKEIQERLEETIESSEKIFENSDGEMQKGNPKTYRFARNANKFSRSLSETIKTVKVPETVNYESLQTLGNDLEKRLTAALQQRAEAYPYITPYFIFDRRRLDVTLKRLADINNELRNFLTTKYAKAKMVEDTSEAIDKLLQTINQADETQKQREQMEQREKSLQQELMKTQQEIANVQSRAELTELMKAEDRIRELRENVKHSLRYLQKPFFKLQSLARSGDIAIPVDEAKKLGDYLSDPFEALATEEEGHPMLKNILRKVDEAITQGKLKLKSTRLRKAQEQIDSVLNRASLNALHKSCMEASSQKRQLLTSGIAAAFENELVGLQEKLRQLQKETEFTSSRVKALEDEHRKLREKIESERKELTETVFQLTGKNIQVVFSQTK